MDNDQLKRRFYPEANVGGFTHVDGTITFFNQLVAVLRPDDVLLDYGAGRGEPILDDGVEYRRGVANFKGKCRHIDGCDIDPIVLQNPFLDSAAVIEIGKPLPYENDRFDIIFSRYVFEHVDNPEFVARELLRVVKPGGIIAATTPNKWGYIGIAARTVPNRFHVRLLSRTQPDRKPEDVFPTRYRLNTPRDLRQAFGSGASIFIAKKAPEPAYHFGRAWVYRFFMWMDKYTPKAFLPVFDVYVKKHEK